MNKIQVWKIVFYSWYWTFLAFIGMLVTLVILGFIFSRFISPAVIMSIIGGFILISFLTFIFSEVLVNLLMQAKIANKDDFPDFIRVSEELFEHKAMWVNPRLYILNMDVPNAMAYGMGIPGFASIAITEKLYEILEPDELKAVVAHELAHIKCKDVGMMTTIGLMVGSLENLRKAFLGGKTSLGKGPFAYIFAGILWFISKVLFKFLSSAISQERELAADALGASYVGSPDPLIRALTKLDNLSDKKESSSTLSDLMISHPGMKERISSLESLKGENDA